MAALGAAGMASSAYLTAIHLQHLGTGAASVCNLGGMLNCDVVNTSAWSEVLRVPVSHIGTLFYFVLLSLAVLMWTRAALRQRLHGYLTIAIALACMASLFLAGVSLFVLKAICVFCMSLYAINLLLLLIVLPGSVAALRALPSQLGADVAATLRPAPLLLMVGVLSGALASMWTLRQAGQRVHERAAERAQAAAVQPGAPPARIDLYDATAPVWGPADAPITIVEVSDFECPFCQAAAGTLAELKRAYPGQLRMVFRHFPLDQSCNKLLKRQIHPNACAAARAAFCAGQQGQFWPYAEKLFDGAVESSDLLEHMRALSLKEEPFKRCLESTEAAARIQQDIDACSKAGVAGVPVILINGRKLAGAQPIEKFRARIDEELAAARSATR